jgi:hypothetical protein
MNQRDSSVQYGHSDVFIRHDPAEIRGLVVAAPRQSQDYQFPSSTSFFLFRHASDQDCRLAGFPSKSSTLSTQKAIRNCNPEYPVRF